MICKDLSSIIIKGKCFENETDIKLFETNERVKIIYGKNGIGKSSICKALLNESKEFESIILKDFSNNKIEMEESDNIHIYNENFIDENIKLNSKGLNSIIMFGEQKEIDDEIEKVKEGMIKKQSELEQKEKGIKPYADVNNINSPEYYTNKITQTLKSDDGWASRDRDIRGKKTKTAVKIELINNLDTNKDESKNKEEYISEYEKILKIYNKIDATSFKIDVGLNKIIFSEDLEENIKNLLGKKVEKPQLTEREKVILTSIEEGKQSFYENVKKQFQTSEKTICPYCFQEVEEIRKKEIIKNINNVLNKNVEEHKTELELIELPIVEKIDGKFKELDEKIYIEIEKSILVIEEHISFIKKKIEEKMSNIYTPIEEIHININEQLNSINNLIDKLELKREEFNKGIDDKNQNQTELLRLNNKIAWFEIKEDYNNYIKQREERHTIELRIKDIKEQLKKINKKMRELENNKSNVSIAVDKINESLGYILYSNERIKIECIDNEYYVKVNNKDVKLENLSIGERNIISLCYFFTTILNNTDKKEEFCNPCLVILDDPISSFDFENKIGIYTFFRYIFSKILRNNNYSKIICFTHSLESVFNLDKVCSDIQRQGKIKYLLKELKEDGIIDFGFKKRNEYMTMLEDIFCFANKGQGYEQLKHTIGNTMRRVLEAYATFNYRKSIEDITNDEMILNKIKDEKQREHFTNSMYRLVLNEESHSYDRARGIPEMNFFDYISVEEKIETAKDILRFIYLLDDIHIKIYLPDKVEEIKNWIK